jgi:hypothetical protein
MISTSLTSDMWFENIIPTTRFVSPSTKRNIEFSFRLLRDLPHKMARKYQSPPVFHHTQVVKDQMSTPLAHCYTIAKLSAVWETDTLGAWYHHLKDNTYFPNVGPSLIFSSCSNPATAQ